jgi:predicted acylesterase/phospholipase RssA
LITPVILDNKCYVDGGVISNYPIKICLDSGKPVDEILGFKNTCINKSGGVSVESTLFDYTLCFLYKVIRSLRIDDKFTQQIQIPNEIVCITETYTIENIRSVLSSAKKRTKLYTKGQESAKEYISKLADISKQTSS